jgi:hypothetical protein
MKESDRERLSLEMRERERERDGFETFNQLLRQKKADSFLVWAVSNSRTSICADNVLFPHLFLSLEKRCFSAVSKGSTIADPMTVQWFSNKINAMYIL